MNVSEEKTKSLWMDTAVAEAPPPDGDQRADVVVIGSGIAGLSTAYELTGRGRSVIVLDRGRIGTGMTARTTAHLASALDDGYAHLIDARGVDIARVVYQSQTAAINRIEAIQANERIGCDFQRVDGYLVLAPGTPASELDEELVACSKAGVPVSDTREPTALHAKNLVRSLRFPNQARFHPLKYLAGLARAITQRGGRLFGDTAVESAMEEKTGVVVKTDRGTVRATDVVFATNSPIGGSVTIHTKQAPYRTYALAATLTRGNLPDALYWDTLDPYHYVRLQPHSEHQDIVIIGGEDHKSGQADDGEARFAALESWARERLPKMGKVIHRWSGQVMEPADYVGFIGRNSGDKHRYIATGDSGQGITNGVIASMLIANLILDGNSPWVTAYDPARMITKNIGGYLSENMTVLRSFAEYLTMGEVAAIERLKPGEGGLFRSGLKKIAVCRDEQGHLHARSASCTHIGCVVHWNSLEQSWDCPCHGSQFAPGGTPLNGPAVAPLPEFQFRQRRLEAAE
jgi:glycine/D-amino acid oxidase-like deaminating enzyme/nitrite reductase/ring-hydroxylating ferredoxin subunit